MFKKLLISISIFLGCTTIYSVGEIQAGSRVGGVIQICESFTISTTIEGELYLFIASINSITQENRLFEGRLVVNSRNITHNPTHPYPYTVTYRARGIFTSSEVVQRLNEIFNRSEILRNINKSIQCATSAYRLF